jgi:hypothetical protein
MLTRIATTRPSDLRIDEDGRSPELTCLVRSRLAETHAVCVHYGQGGFRWYTPRNHSNATVSGWQINQEENVCCKS